MSRNVKVSAALVALFAMVIAVIALASGGDDKGTRAAATRTAPSATTAPGTTVPPTTTETAPAPGATVPPTPAPKGRTTPAPKTKTGPSAPSGADTLVVAPDPRTLGRPGNGGVTFTEFLDFECPACGAAYPLVEQLRQQFAGRVTFNIRYFPLPSHRNAMPAALAAEAAAQQGRLDPMYRQLFETQAQWGGKSSSQARVFRGFAQQLGLDMTRYDADVRSRKTRQRVRRDLAAADALKLSGTPSFFINEQPVTPQSPDDLRKRLDAALAGKVVPKDPAPRGPAPNAPAPDELMPEGTIEA